VPGEDPGTAECHVRVVVVYLSSLEVWLGCQVGALVLLSVMCPAVVVNLSSLEAW